jgi:ATP-dependent RNA helicase SUPV3L1/SUV3
MKRDFSAILSMALQEFKQKFDPSDPVLKNWDQFESRILQAARLQDSGPAHRWGSLRQLKASLQQTYLRYGVSGVKKELEFLYRADDITAKFSTPHIAEQQKVADLRYPAEWYPQARSMQRTVHLHVGPTNSGKTYHALKRLEASQKGFYAGPLRLLAQEVYTRFNAQGISCGLITGDDVRLPEGESPRIVSNTVEMVNLGKEFEVGVIDEIQMIADPRRGWAWTRAFLGARASELHLCGEVRTVPLIRELVALTGDTLEIHHYERLNPLRVMKQSLKGDFRKLQKGDCLVSFSRVGIHALKNEIERTTGRRAAIVYGSLPAEIRTQQASLFNDPDNDYDFLVASDAIGMGLNL